MDAPFAINPTLSGIAVAYRNQALIADAVLPRINPVGTQTFKYTSFPVGEGYTVPDTRVGRRGAPNVVEFGGTQLTATTDDYALEDEIPQSDIDQAIAAAALNPDLAQPQAHSTEMLANLLALDREVRVAGLVFAPGAYAAANKTQLAGASQFSDSTSDPISVITDGLDIPLARPNRCVMGRAAWSKTRRHPKLVKAANSNAGDSGLITAQAFKDMFELDELNIGESFVNTAKKGQQAAFSRTWGKHILFYRQETVADTKRGMTFGYTVPYGTRVASDWPDKGIGFRGGVRVRVGESVRELITASDLAYFIQDAVA